ncbi:MAG: PKD domain-containing protein [Thermonemataceae bacterium]
MKHLHWLWLYLATSASLLAQCPTIDNTTGFGTPNTVCPDEPVNFTNPQPGTARYEWDFCARDLEGELRSEFLLKLPGVFDPAHVDIIQEGEEYHAFAISKENRLYRLDFDANFNFQLLTDLGNPNDVIDVAEPIKLIKQNGVWYGFALNTFSSSRFNLVKFTFENGIKEEPTGRDIFNSNFTFRPRALEVAQEGANSYVFVADRSPSRIIRLNFGTSFSNDTFVESFPINIGDNDNVLGMDLVQECDGNWSLIYSSLDGDFAHIDFGSSLQNTPSVVSITSLFPPISLPVGISVHYDHGSYYGIIVSGLGDIYRADLTYPLLSGTPTVVNLGKGGNPSSRNRGGLAIVRVDGAWKGVINNNDSDETYLITLQQNCEASPSVSAAISPSPVSYRSLGVKDVSLSVYDIDDNLIAQYLSTITIEEDALVSDFTFTNPCGFTVDFNNTSLGSNTNIDSWTWDFGDGSAPVGDESPSHTYTAAGNYEVALTVLANNGCSNTMTRTVTVTDGNDLEARFGMPTGLCVNSVFSPNDLSNFGSSAPDEANGYYWDFGDGTFSPFPNPDKVYTSTGTYTITLTIQNEEGCTDVFSENVTVQEEIPVSFTVPAQICVNTPLIPTNMSATGAESYFWEVEGVATSSEYAPTFNFTTAGSYDISLTVQQNGCTQTFTERIEVLPVPQIVFITESTDGNPFELTFLNRSTGASLFQWDFGDGQTSTDIDPTHLYASEGEFLVTLTATNTVTGCTETFTQPVQIGALRRDLAITQAELIETEEGLQSLSLLFENQGNTTFTNVDVLVSLSDGQSFTQTLTVDVIQGESKAILLDTLFEASQLTALDYICAEALIEEDTDLNNNRACANLTNSFQLFEPFPNPTNRIVTFQYITTEANEVTLLVYDTIGKLDQQQLYTKAGFNEYTYNVASLSPGLYLFVFQIGDENYTKKVVVQ